MKYLFVDYDQGAGGEFFCYCLSLSPQCYKLEHIVTETNRFKVVDIFGQEFLKPKPKPVVPVISDLDVKYHVVPTHRHTNLAQSLLNGDVKSIRIQTPTSGIYWNYVKSQQLKKVLLAIEPTDSMFVGFLRILVEKTGNKSFLSRINRNMDNLTLTLLAHNIEPTAQNKDDYIKKLFESHKPEPDFKYNIVIPYENLITSPHNVADMIYCSLNIEVDVDLLKTYQKNFNNAQHSQT